MINIVTSLTTIRTCHNCCLYEINGDARMFCYQNVISIKDEKEDFILLFTVVPITLLLFRKALTICV